MLPNGEFEWGKYHINIIPGPGAQSEFEQNGKSHSRPRPTPDRVSDLITYFLLVWITPPPP